MLHGLFTALPIKAGNITPNSDKKITFFQNVYVHNINSPLYSCVLSRQAFEQEWG